jgi:hypothetical protein
MNAPKAAVFKIEDTGKTIATHFNPATLSITVATKLTESKGKKKNSVQKVNEGSAKLSVDLVYDTTDTLENVCDKTVEVARLLGEKNQPPPRVTFDWGAFSFTGIVDSFKETLEFFSADGVPLRSAVSISMTKDEDIYSRGPAGKRAAGWSSDTSDPQAQVQTSTTGDSTTATATQGGDPAAGRTIAAQNGEESMRFPSAPTHTVDTAARLAPPVSFASGGAEFGASAGFSVGGGVSVGGGITGGFSATFGGGTSAGVTASQGAFAGLRALPITSLRVTRLDPSRILPRVETDERATGDGAVFELGGRVRSQGSRLGRSSRVRIRFEGGEP